jgi:TonB family protein
MRLFASLTLAAALACLCATPTPAQHGSGGPGKSAREEDYTRVFTSREVTQRARLTRRPEPVYPREARRKAVQGVVTLRIILRADGRVDDKIEVVRSLPEGLTEEAIRVAKLIEFEPAQKDGRKVSQYALVEYNFNLY